MGLDCITSDPIYKSLKYFEDPFTSLFLGCSKGPASFNETDVGCGCPDKPKETACELKRNVSDEPFVLPIKQDNLLYGGSCTYLLKTDCGYPNITLIDAEDLDVLVGYNTSYFASQKNPFKQDFTSSSLQQISSHWLLNENLKRDG